MKTIYLSSALMLFSSVGVAKTSPPTKASLSSLMTEIRDPYHTSAKKKEHLQFAQKHMQAILARELKTTPTNLANTFIANPSHMDTLWENDWAELQTEFYTSLHQQVLRERWDSRIKNNKMSDYGKSIAEAMIAHLGKYSGIKEGRLYNRWNTITVSASGKQKHYRIPYFIFANNVDNLIALDAHTPYEEILPKASAESPGNPSVETLLRHTNLKNRDSIQDLAEKVQLNHRIYIRAVANSAKTIASIHYLTGEFTLAQTESKVSSFLSGFCDGCSAKEKADYQKAAISYVQKMKKEFLHEYNPEKIVKTFCADLRSHGYAFEGKKPLKEAIDELASKPKPYSVKLPPMPVMVRDNTRVDTRNMQLGILMHKLEAIRKTVYEHDLGVLFLTNSLSTLSKNREPTGTNLGCNQDTMPSDIRRVKLAIVEARGNVEKYIQGINSKIRNNSYTTKETNDTLEYFTQTNVSATGEAVMTFPQGINHVIDSIHELDRDLRRRKKIDTVVTWGGTIIGVGLAITGIGAPEGAAILIAVAAMTKGAIAGSYYLYRSQQEKAFYQEMLTAKTGLGTQFYLQGNLSEHYNNYRSLRISALTEFASSAIQFAKIHKLALVKTNGDVARAHGLIKKGMQTARASGKEVSGNQLTELIVSISI